MGAARFGELLGRFVPISGHDVAEIMEEQAVTNRRFGQIAMSLGLCRPQHVWQAWWAQLAHRPEHVNLAQLGIDTQALAHLPAALARRYEVVPVRAMDNQLVVAATEPSIERARAELPALINRQVQFVVATAEQMSQALREAYGDAE